MQPGLERSAESCLTAKSSENRGTNQTVSRRPAGRRDVGCRHIPAESRAGSYRVSISQPPYRPSPAPSVLLLLRQRQHTFGRIGIWGARRSVACGADGPDRLWRHARGLGVRIMAPSSKAGISKRSQDQESVCKRKNNLSTVIASLSEAISCAKR